MNNTRSKKGFTLIELLVVIAIIGVLSSVVIAAVNSGRPKGKAAKTLQQIKSIETALKDTYGASGEYANETALGLGTNPSIQEMIDAGILSEYFSSAPVAGFGTSGEYLYDNDRVAGGSTDYYNDTDCTLDDNDKKGVNILITGVFGAHDDIAAALDAVVDKSDGFGCGKIKRHGATDTILLYHISDRYNIID